jgi:hypothetical protein
LGREMDGWMDSCEGGGGLGCGAWDLNNKTKDSSQINS